MPGTSRIEAITPDGGGPVEFGYDGHGNTTSVGVRTFTYNAANRLVGIADSSLSVRYVYNGLGRRVIKEVDGIRTVFHYGMGGHMIAETPAGGAVDQGSEYIYKGNSLLTKVDVADGALYSYHTNYLGAVHQLVNADNTVVWEAVYQPFRCGHGE